MAESLDGRRCADGRYRRVTLTNRKSHPVIRVASFFLLMPNLERPEADLGGAEDVRGVFAGFQRYLFERHAA